MTNEERIAAKLLELRRLAVNNTKGAVVNEDNELVKFTVSDTEPADPEEGDVWVDIS